MFSKDTLWEMLQPLVRDEGFELYDLELPLSKSGIFRIFITSGKATLPADGMAQLETASTKRNSVTIDDCARVSKRISAMLEGSDSFLAELTLEVSSPGINRNLRRLEHFEGAVGERIRLKGSRGAFMELPGKHVLLGTLLSVQGENLHFEEESSKAVLDIAYSDVQEARVDFLF